VKKPFLANQKGNVALKPYIALNPVLVDKFGTEDSGVILIFIYYTFYITVLDKVLSIHFLFWGYF